MDDTLTTGQVLGFAIRTEKLGREMYASLARSFADDEELATLFSTLAEDERFHQAELEELRERLSDDAQRRLSRDDSGYLEGLAREKIFARIEETTAAGAISERADALQAAYELEKATLLYYDGVQEVLGENQVLDRIIAMEKRHLRQVMKYIMAPESKVRGASDAWT